MNDIDNFKSFEKGDKYCVDACIAALSKYNCNCNVFE